jgi:hypothetical protein
MSSLYENQEFKNIRHVDAEIFAVEQLCKQYGLEDVRRALFRVRVSELNEAEVIIRGRVKREAEAPSLPGGSNDTGDSNGGKDRHD